MKKKPLPRQVKNEELLDLLENTGVLQEVNRCFFHPLGIELLLNKNLDLELHKTDDPKGIVSHTVDRFKLKVFNDFRNAKHTKRHEILGYILQIDSLLRKDKMAEDKDLKLSSPENLKLLKLLRCVDDTAYEVKKAYMENSKDKDVDGKEIPFGKLFRKIDFDIANGRWIDAIAKMILINNQEEIEIELDRIKEIKAKQDKVFKKEK